jgi:DNA-binding transcriptional MerR regulator
VALRRLGFGLERIAALLDADPAEVRRLLEDRRAELVAQVDEDRARLAEVERRLRLMEGDTMQMTFSERPLPAVAVPQLTAEPAARPA